MSKRIQNFPQKFFKGLLLIRVLKCLNLLLLPCHEAGKYFFISYFLLLGVLGIGNMLYSLLNAQFLKYT